MYNDPIADLLTRIRNGQARRKIFVNLRLSKTALRILEVLKGEGFIGDFEVVKGDKPFSEIRVQLKYYSNGRPAISSCSRVSKGGRRVYRKCSELKRVKGGLGISVVSTSQGVMSDKAARDIGIGGEVMAAIS